MVQYRMILLLWVSLLILHSLPVTEGNTSIYNKNTPTHYTTTTSSMKKGGVLAFHIHPLVSPSIIATGSRRPPPTGGGRCASGGTPLVASNQHKKFTRSDVGQNMILHRHCNYISTSSSLSYTSSTTTALFSKQSFKKENDINNTEKDENGENDTLIPENNNNNMQWIRNNILNNDNQEQTNINNAINTINQLDMRLDATLAATYNLCRFFIYDITTGIKTIPGWSIQDFILLGGTFSSCIVLSMLWSFFGLFTGIFVNDVNDEEQNSTLLLRIVVTAFLVGPIWILLEILFGWPPSSPLLLNSSLATTSTIATKAVVDGSILDVFTGITPSTSLVYDLVSVISTGTIGLALIMCIGRSALMENDR